MSEYIPLEDLMKDHDSLFKLVLLAADRGNEISGGIKPLIKTRVKKISSVALREIATGKVKYVNVDAKGKPIKEKPVKK